MKALCKQNQCGRQEGGSVHRGLLVEDGDEDRRGHQEDDDEESELIQTQRGNWRSAAVRTGNWDEDGKNCRSICQLKQYRSPF